MLFVALGALVVAAAAVVVIALARPAGNPGFAGSGRQTDEVTTPTKESSRAQRLREYEALRERAVLAVSTMGVLVRGREVRGWRGAEPPEVAFASAEIDERALPAGVWVALRRDDVQTVLEAITEISLLSFVVSQHEEMGEGYRLQTVEETRTVPDVSLLLAQLGATLGIPADVLGVLAEWGADDPRTRPEIDALLDSRVGPVEAPPGATLTMSVQETADVLQLSPAQAKVLATLVRCAGVTITG